MNTYVIAVDLSDQAPEVIFRGCNLATKLGAQAVVVHSVPSLATWRGYEPSFSPSIEEDLEKSAKEKLDKFVKTVAERKEGITNCIKEVKVFSGDPAQMITDYAEEIGAKLIIVGYRGHSALERLLVGSTASNIAKYAKMSVLIHRPDQSIIY